MAEGTWPTHAAPRITELTFANALMEGPRVFNSMEEIGTIWMALLAQGVDPSYALGQFWTESLYGNAGWNIWSEPPLKSWGNVLYVNSQVKDRPGVGEYKASNGFEYTYYPDWTTGVEDYALLLKQYVDTSPHPRYGKTDLIYGATAKWMGKVPGSDEHLKYLDIVLGRMDRYDARPDWEGEMAVSGPDISYSTNQRYAVKGGERWFMKPGGTTSYQFRADGKAVYFGQVMGTSWVQIRIMTARFSNDGKTRPVLGFFPNFDPKRVSAA